MKYLALLLLISLSACKLQKTRIDDSTKDRQFGLGVDLLKVRPETPPPTPPQHPGYPFQITGSITDESGQRIDGVKVVSETTIASAGPVRAEETVNSSFFIQRTGAMNLKLEFVKEGFKPETREYTYSADRNRNGVVQESDVKIVLKRSN